MVTYRYIATKLNRTMIRSIRIFAISLTLAAPETGWSKVASGPEKNPAEWGKEFEVKGRVPRTTVDKIATIARCVVVKNNNGALKILPQDANESAAESFIEPIDDKTVEMTMEINRVFLNSPDAAPSTHLCESDLDAAAKCFQTDAVLEVSEKQWKLYKLMPKTGKLKLAVTKPADDTPNYIAWAQAQMRYDGVILDEKDGYILALLPKHPYSGDTQALTIRNSNRKILLGNAKIEKGSSLLQLVKQEGRYAIFKIVLADENADKATFAPGTKIVLESKKN